MSSGSPARFARIWSNCTPTTPWRGDRGDRKGPGPAGYRPDPGPAHRRGHRPSLRRGQRPARGGLGPGVHRGRRPPVGRPYRRAARGNRGASRRGTSPAYPRRAVRAPDLRWRSDPRERPRRYRAGLPLRGGCDQRRRAVQKGQVTRTHPAVCSSGAENSHGMNFLGDETLREGAQRHPTQRMRFFRRVTPSASAMVIGIGARRHQAAGGREGKYPFPHSCLTISSFMLRST